MKFGRVKVPNYQPPTMPDVSDPEVVRALLQDAVQVVRAERDERKAHWVRVPAWVYRFLLHLGIAGTVESETRNG